MSPDACAVAAMAALEGSTDARLRSVIGGNRPTAVAERLYRSGPTAQQRERWPELARVSGALSPGALDAVAERYSAAGVTATFHGAPEYPAVLAIDRAAPAALFWRGDPAILARRRVAIVGTRNATPVGMRVARRLADELTEAGVAVVSGLARGIDAAAHDAVRVASANSAVGVVGSGHDVVFPQVNRGLWEWVAAHGLLLSAYPLGMAPRAAHFPQRNRIIAALAEVVVVVESRATGGSLITAREALRRGVDVMAVPGSVLSSASAGTNSLIADGAAAVRDTTDVLVALGLDTRRAGTLPFDPRPEPGPVDRRVLEAFAGDPLPLDGVASRLPDPIAEIAMAVGRLQGGGWLVEVDGWFQPVGPLAVGASPIRSSL